MEALSACSSANTLDAMPGNQRSLLSERRAKAWWVFTAATLYWWLFFGLHSLLFDLAGLAEWPIGLETTLVVALYLGSVYWLVRDTVMRYAPRAIWLGILIEEALRLLVALAGYIGVHSLDTQLVALGADPLLPFPPDYVDVALRIAVTAATVGLAFLAARSGEAASSRSWEPLVPPRTLYRIAAVAAALVIFIVPLGLLWVISEVRRIYGL